MGLSKLLPCRRRRQEKEEAKKRSTSINNTKPVAAAEQPSAKKSENIVDSPTVTNPSSHGEPVADPSNRVENKTDTLTQKSPELSISQRVWNRAYDELAGDKGTSGLVEDYVKLLPTATNPDGDVTVPAGEDFATEMKDPVRRQAVLKEAIQAGQKKIAKTEKITNTVGNVIGFVNKFKDVIDLAVSTNPQAALPWAGVCIGLQSLLNPAQQS
ncbi:hypothetical protein N7462_002151 [Penicillium macrosclerotiorum]|uniref:uncharacterized protein n=1 Tax=Penicillium macrosclerotiorum TaxID=303699 RepID=UPI0025496A20|nr:uncharacterized protein N7462_002151 [Penicillium macrosclerotiorum]KAJ5692728.1 hypothetical protein N7462_002151 [Penicillium macrosclerotiorum]